MKKQICILTKSYKHGGYCVAGIDVVSKEWIRLVNSEDPSTDEIRKDQLYINGKAVDCLDVVELEFVKNTPNFCQIENWLLDNSIAPKFVKRISPEELVDMAKFDEDNFFILNKLGYLDKSEVSDVRRSLYLYQVRNVKIDATSYETYDEIKYKYKCNFEYNGNKYTNISLTDPVFRNVAQNGNIIDDAFIVASLPCVPYNDGFYYKFIAKIIPIDKNLMSYLQARTKEKDGDLKTKISSSPFDEYGVVVQVQQTPGIALFENYEQLRTIINKGVLYYSSFEYSLDNYGLALKHHQELKYVKSVLEKTKREIVKSYNAPLETVEKKIDELIGLIKIPFQKIDVFIKQNEKEAKRYEILKFAEARAFSSGLQKHAESVLDSPSFFESRWLNVSCSKATWKFAVELKIQRAKEDINYILSLQNDDIASILAHYYQTLSMDSVKEFIYSLQSAKNISDKKEPALGELKEPDKIKDYPSGTDNIILNDFEVINHIVNSINPYTGELITGIDDLLRRRLCRIADLLKTFPKK